MTTKIPEFWIERSEGELIDGHAYETVDEARAEAQSYIENDEGPLFIVSTTRNGTVFTVEVVE